MPPQSSGPAQSSQNRPRFWIGEDESDGSANAFERQEKKRAAMTSDALFSSYGSYLGLANSAIFSTR